MTDTTPSLTTPTEESGFGLAVGLPLLLGAVAFFAVYTINGAPGLPAPHSDALSYLTAAASLLDGRGLVTPFPAWNSPGAFVPLSHYPPGFSLLLALGMVFGLSAVQSAVVWISLGAGTSVAAAAYLAQRWAGARWGLACGLILMATAPLVRLHTSIWSEPVFLGLLGVLVVVLTVRPKAFWLQGVVSAAATLVRYLGVGLAAGATLLAGMAPGTPRERLTRMLKTGAPTALLLVGLSLRSKMTETDVRVFRWYGLGGDAWERMGAGLREWILPWTSSTSAAVAAGLVLAGALGLMFWASRGRAESEASRGTLAALALSAGVATVVFTARLFADPLIPLDTRIFSPVIYALIIGSVGAAAHARARIPRALAGGGLVVLAVWALASINQIRQGVESLRATGSFYTAPFWNGSTVLSWAGQSQHGTVLYSNEPELIYFRVGRSARRLPSHRAPGSLDEFAGVFRSAPGAVLLINPIRPGEPEPGPLMDRLGLVVAASDATGTVLVPPNP